MVGTLIKTNTLDEFFIGMIINYFHCRVTDRVRVGVMWNDCDETTETFSVNDDCDGSAYYFYDKGRWWQIDQNFYKFKRLLESE